jgi:metal-responsive CopG/Arc/MetJ family transcriptional regulator
MPRQKKCQTKAINIRIPLGLLEDVDAVIDSGKSDYADRTDMVKGALRKEIEYQKAKLEGRITEREL